MSDQSKPIDVSYGMPTLNDWKLYFRNMKQAPLAEREATPESSEESSFELDESFRELLNRKRQQMAEQTREEKMLASEEAATAREECSGATSHPRGTSGNDSTFLEQDSICKISDMSFEEMERLCGVVDNVKRLSVGGVEPAVESQLEKALPSIPTTFGDITQLDDVDEPSGFWENTILPGSGQIMSPMKRVHLLRPSTIIEESTINEAGGSKNSSIDTYVSAQQRESHEAGNSSSAISSSEIYRTAEDTFATDSYARSSAMDSGLVYDNTTSDNQTAFGHHEQHEDESAYSKNSTAEAGLTDVQHVILLDSSASESEQEDDQHAQMDPLNSVLSEQNDSIVTNEQSSMLDDLEESDYKDHNVSELEEMPDRFNDTMEETDFMLRQGMKLMAMKKKEEGQQQQQQKSRTNSESDDGATYTRHVANLTPADNSASKAIVDSSNYTYLTPSSVMRSKLNVSHGTGSGCKQTLFYSVGRSNSAKKLPGPPSGGSASGGAFKKPAVSRLPQAKLGAYRKFDHIVSPIGAYIKKTPQSILQTKINCPNKNLIDVLHSENRDSVMSAGRSSKENHYGVAKGYTPSLPGKGVISSNRAHVLDERNLVRIPGGEKMQKLINNSPTMVIRHEGRIRYAGESGGGTGAGRRLMMNDSTIGDDSLKDISVASNDVSVRVLHDAKRF
ncbi:septin interacting protein [Anopheles sinensis]|uniref:Septin interacting protein n=1 Tax=Anopheles sinensis TaxID=74873 RepID=A0A084VMH7_ANOSI|nr:septin interacting protein [Anopheles sinensis]